MTNLDLMAQILSEAIGKPIEDMQHIVTVMAKAFGTGTKLTQELTEARAEELLGGLRKELPAIRQWLIQGGHLMQSDMKTSAKH